MSASHLKTVAGILKVVGIITAIIATSLALSAYYISPYNKSCQDNEPFQPSSEKSNGALPTLRPPGIKNSTDDPDYDWAPVLWMEKFHITVTMSSWVISTVLLLLYICKSDLESCHIYKSVNFVFHFIYAILLVVSAIFMVFATLEIDSKICQAHGLIDGRINDCQMYLTKMSAAGMALLTAVLYAALSINIVGTKLYEQV